MKVIFFTLTDKLGGAEQLLFKLASHYKKEGEEVSVCILGIYSNNAWSKEFPDTYYCDNNIRKLIKHIKKESYNLAYSSQLLLNACLGVLRSVGCLKTNKLICRESTLVFGRYKGLKLLKYKIAYFLGYRKIDLLIIQSDLMRLSLLKNVPFLKERTNIVTIPNLFEFPEEKENKIIVESPFIVSAGRLIPEKGFDILIQSFKLVTQVFPHMKLVILGEGPCRDQLLQLIIHNELDKKVFLKGFVNDVYPYFKKAALCIVSSRKEGFPNVLLQMMSQNNKVISTLCAGGIENIDGIATCLPNSIECLYNKIIEQLQNNAVEENRIKFDLELRKRSIENYLKKIENSLKNEA